FGKEGVWAVLVRSRVADAISMRGPTSWARRDDDPAAARTDATRATAVLDERRSKRLIRVSSMSIVSLPRNGANRSVASPGRLDPQAVEGAIDEDGRDEEDHGGEDRARCPWQADRQLDGQEAKQGRELDDGIHGHRGGVLERVTDGVADHGCGVE